MSAPRRGRGVPVDPAQVAVPLVVGLVLVVVGALWLVVHLGWWLSAGPHPHLVGNPFALAIGVPTGATPWPPAGLGVAVALGVVLVVLGVLGGLVARSVRRRPRVDRAAALMGTGRDLAPLSVRSARATARRLGGPVFDGLPVAVSVAGGAQLVSGPEDVTVDVWGPRSGKTTTRVIPAGLTAPGFLVVTSNKRDACDALRDPRAAVGEVWVWDPQGLVGAEPDWYWNPLSYVTDENQATQLARLWTASARPAGAKVDAFFDPAGEELLGHYLHAAALTGGSVLEVYRWLTRPLDRTAATILAGAGFPLSAASVLEVVEAPDKQRAGVFGAAKRTVSFLTNTRATRWVVPSPDRGAFDPAEFVRSAGTLFALSREGVGDTGPLTTALTVAVCEAAEELAKVSPGGRLAVPGTVLLDEAANVCRWYNLPDLFSHYGSRGVLLSTFLQSWSQGEEVWGRAGMAKMWSAANVKVVGRGLSEVAFLRDVAELVGTYRTVEVSRSSGRGGPGVNTSMGSEQILTVGDLAAIPAGRVVVLTSGAPPVLGRTVPWWEGKGAAAVDSSIRAHDPVAADTLVARVLEPDVPPAGSVWAETS